MADLPALEFLHVDADILVVNKPAGLPVLPDGWQPNAPYLLRLLESDFGQPWVVHRLDKVTSGVIVFARNPEAHRALDLQFQRHETRKIYHALLNGLPRWDEHTARHPLRMNVGHTHRTKVDGAHGKPSETYFRVLERYQAAAWLEAIPKTGRTHQVRVHAFALGHPLLGDVLYGAPTSELITRPALHALSLTFVHPKSEETVTYAAPYPEDFRAAMGALSDL